MKKFKNYILSLSLILMAVVCPILLTACGEKPATLEISQSFKTEYYVGEELDVSTGILKYTEKEEPRYVAITSEMISAFNTDTVGTRKMVLTYNDKSITISYTVKHFELMSNVIYNQMTSDVFKNYMQFDLANNKAYYYNAGGEETNITYDLIEMTISNEVKSSGIVYTLTNADFDSPATITMKTKSSFVFSLRNEIFIQA